ncbi:MFS transporter [Burkholderia thailandensis]|uniref:MFS transporter n=2 Tax=Burkholderia thailandensis TaxID=57975 RepID=UPI0022ABFFEC|nr:MFS transporter [Burkholderia thailandensis]MCZ2894806.1 MFS transporter [Burkholderia thailandensis]
MKTHETERHALRALASANFATGSMSYGVVGALPSLAADWRIAPGRAALLMAAFSIAFALGAPVLQMLIGHRRRRGMLIAGLLTTSLATLAGALAPSFGWLLATRIVAGIGAGAVSPVATAVGAGLAPAERQGKALAIVFAGVTLSSVVSAPLSAWIAQALGWRATFGWLAAVALGSAAWIAGTVRDASRGERMRAGGLVALLARPATAAGLSVVVLQTGAFFCTYTLILSLLHRRFGASAGEGAFALLVFGVTGVLGNLVAQRVARRWSADPLLIAAMLAMLAVFACLAALAATGFGGDARLVAALALLMLWALMQDLFYPSQLRRVVGLEPHCRGMALALNSSGIFAGISLGSALGGRVADTWGVGLLAPTSAALTVAALIALGISRRYAGEPRASAAASAAACAAACAAGTRAAG